MEEDTVELCSMSVGAKLSVVAAKTNLGGKVEICMCVCVGAQRLDNSSNKASTAWQSIKITSVLICLFLFLPTFKFLIKKTRL
jgi:hypothetical protein